MVRVDLLATPQLEIFSEQTLRRQRQRRPQNPIRRQRRRRQRRRLQQQPRRQRRQRRQRSLSSRETLGLSAQRRRRRLPSYLRWWSRVLDPTPRQGVQ